MKAVLIILIGNRDIQVKKDSKVLQAYHDMWLPNNDDPDFMILDKGKSFLKSSKLIHDHFEKDFRSEVELPMIEQTISEIHDKIDIVHLVASRQNPLDDQDCYYFGRIAKKMLAIKPFRIKLTYFNCNPTEFDPLMKYFLELYNNYAGARLFVGNSGGTPDMRAATYMAGIFRNIQFITINARTKTANINNFKSQENAILRHIIDKMLNVYDYEGIAYLPVSEEVRKECLLALDLYNLILDKSGSLLPATVNYGDKSKNAVLLLINNMAACYKQGRFTDVIGRIYRIEEAIWHILFYFELKANGIIDDSDKYHYLNSDLKKSFKKFETILSNDQIIKKIINQYYPDVINGEFFRVYPEVPIKSGKNFYYYFFKSINKNIPVCSYFAKINFNYDLSLNKLSQLRNKSIMGHGYKGISKDDIVSVVGPFDDFTEALIKLVNEHMGIKYRDIFAEVNERISGLIGNLTTIT